MHKKIQAIISIWLFALIILCDVTVAAEPDLYANYFSVIDANTGRVLFSKNDDKQVPMASTTKILTCIIILEEGNPDDYACVSSKAASAPKVNMNVKEGEYYKVKDLLYGLMLESYNDAAIILAEYLCGSVEDFSKKMNEKAEEIGCLNYNFVTPNGLDGNNELGAHSISANDLAKIMTYCTMQSSQNDIFLEITRTQSYQIPIYKKNEQSIEKTGKTISCTNKNALLSKNEVISGKTGYTNDAGYCYVCHMNIDGQPISFSLLACGWPNNKNYKWKDSNSIIEFIKSNYSLKSISYPIVTSEEFPSIANAKKEVGMPENTKLKVQLQSTSMNYYLSETDSINFIFKLPDKINAPIDKKTQIGYMEVFINEQIVDSVPLYTTKSVSENTYFHCLEEILDSFTDRLINLTRINACFEA